MNDEWKKKETIIREILTWDGALNAYNKVYTILSYLHGWTSEEEVHRITASCDYYRERKNL